MKKFRYLILPLLLLVAVNGCELEQYPDDTVATEQVVSSTENMMAATTGQLYTIKSRIRIRGYYGWQSVMPRVIDMQCHMGNDLQATNSYGDLKGYGHYTTAAYTDDWGMNKAAWGCYYRNIVVCNSIIGAANPQTDEEKNMVGMNHFLRAHWYMQLLRVWTRPYTHTNGSGMGVPLRTEETDPVEPLTRASIQEVMDQVVSDLTKAESMLKPAGDSRGLPSKEAAAGMLSRAYVWMAQPDNPSDPNIQLAIDAANRCLSSAAVDLEPQASYFGSTTKRDTLTPIGTPINHYWSDAQNSQETLFCVATVPTDADINPRGAMWMRTADGVGWGQHCVSDWYRAVIDCDPPDLRTNLVEPHYLYNADGSLKMEDIGGGKMAPTMVRDNTFPLYNTNKFAYAHGGMPHMADIVYLRAAEVYLNRAEAYAKADNVAAALADVNVVRNRAGATPINSLADFQTIYPLNPGNPVDYPRGETPNAPDILDVVLTERFIELAWEFNTSLDKFRNKRGMFRNYLATTLPLMVIPWDSDQIVAPIPRPEIEVNPLLIQNPIPPELYPPSGASDYSLIWKN